MSSVGVPIYLDIETVPGQAPFVLDLISEDAEKEKARVKAPGNYKNPDAISAYIREKEAEIDASADERWRRTSLDGGLGQIVAMSIAVGDDIVELYGPQDWQSSEPLILEWMNETIAGAYDKARHVRPYFVGHNIIGFDLRFIQQRCIVNGIKPHPVIPFDAKPWDERVFDTMTRWAGVGNRISLDKLCKILSIPGKPDDIDGSKVWDFVQAGKIFEVADYCAGDVERVRQVHRKMTFGGSDAA